MDADALNILSKRKELLHLIPKGSVLTPHAKEYERMFGSSVNSMLRLEHARAEAIRLNITIVLKDHHTIVVTPEGECWYNTTGNAGLATAGSGDVLTGLITALMAQGYHGHEAAMLGVWLHGIAGDLCLEKQSEESLIAGDVIEGLGSAFKELQ
jgi:NAD(P)H-hydrate epimerase